MNAAIQVQLDGGQTMLVTEADNSLAWHRAQHGSWGGRGTPRDSDHDDGPLACGESDTPDLAASIPLVKLVLHEVARGRR